jgi:hypothetical protein
MRRVLLVVILLVGAVTVPAAPAAAPEWCPDRMIQGNHHLSSFAVNPPYVAAELGWTGASNALLRARTSGNSLGPWERFQFVCAQGPDIYGIKSVANGRFVSAELGWSGSDYGLLRARATSIGPWERFRIPNTAATSIRSMANGRWVSAEAGWSGSRRGLLRARATAVGPWEVYTVW